MPSWLLSPRVLVPSLAATAASLLLACSSSQSRDVNYGTDAGLGFVPPDAPPRNDAAPAKAEVSGEAAAPLDSGGADETPVDSLADEGG
jgi:hypothetical protein